VFPSPATLFIENAPIWNQFTNVNNYDELKTAMSILGQTVMGKPNLLLEHYSQHKLLTENASIFNKKTRNKISYVNSCNHELQSTVEFFYDKQIQLNQHTETYNFNIIHNTNFITLWFKHVYFKEAETKAVLPHATHHCSLDSWGGGSSCLRCWMNKLSREIQMSCKILKYSI
jgi:hypothetical protein